MIKTYCFSTPGIQCISCVGPLEDALKRLKIDRKLKTWNFDLTHKRLTVESEDDSPKRVQDALDNAGIETKLILDIAPEVLSKQTKRRRRLTLGMGIFGTTSGLLLLLLMLVLNPTSLVILIPIAVASSLLTLILGWGTYKEAFRQLFKSGKLSMDTLFTLSTATVIVVSLTAFFVPWLPMMWEVGLLIFGFRHLGVAIRESLEEATGVEARFQDRLPAFVEVWQQGKKALKDVVPGDIILINAGEIIPLDGVSRKKSWITETLMTGSILPRETSENELLQSGMAVAKGTEALHLEVTHGLTYSYLAKLDKRIKDTHSEKAPIQEVADKLLQYLIPGVLILAVLVSLTISFFFPLAIALQCGVAVLVSACPCTLGLIVPLSLKIGVNKAAEHGVRFKSSKKLQEASRVDAVVFDLNGTLTTSMPTVRTLKSIALGVTDRMVLAYSAALEAHSDHPFANVIKDYAFFTLPQENRVSVEEVDTSHHAGVKGVIAGEPVMIGNEDMMKKAKIVIPNIDISPPLAGGDQLIYLARSGMVIGYVVLSTPLRQGAEHLIVSLQNMGKTVYLCTGADQNTANRYATKLGVPLDQVWSGCVGSDVADNRQARSKPSCIKELKQKYQCVAMVGDAGNDAEAIEASDFGIVVKSLEMDGVTAARTDVTIENHSLGPIFNTFSISNQTVRHIKQSLWISLSYNAAALLLASGLLLSVGIVLNPAVGAALMIVQAVLIILSAYHFKKKAIPPLIANNQLEQSYKKAIGLGLKPSKAPYPLANQHVVAPEEPAEAGFENVPNFDTPLSSAASA